MGNSKKARRSWIYYVGLAFLILLIIGVGVAGWGIYVSLQAEINLHATISAIQIVDLFVQQKERWPNSWDELKEVQIPKSSPTTQDDPKTSIYEGDIYARDWPKQLDDLKSRVTIDFQVNAGKIANQSPEEFTAIKPIGPFYEYRDYGYLESLQKTLRERLKNKMPSDQ